MTDNLEQRLRTSLRSAALPSAPDSLYVRLGALAATRSAASRSALVGPRPARTLAWVGVVVLLIAALALAAVGSHPSPRTDDVTAPQAALNRYLTALVAGDCATAGRYVDPVLIGGWNDALCGGATHVTAFKAAPYPPGYHLQNGVILPAVLTTTGSTAGLRPGDVDVSFLLQHESSGAWLITEVYPAGPILPSPVPTPMNPWTAPADWPGNTPPSGFEATAHERCMPSLSATELANLPLVLHDYKADNGTTYWALVFANATSTAACVHQEGPGGALGGTSGGGSNGPAWTLGDATLKGHAGLSVVFSSAAQRPLDWNTAMGLIPPGATTVRMVVGSRVVDAVIAHDMYTLAWQGPLAPSALIAWDEQGNELDRIDSSALAQVFSNPPAPSGFVWSTLGLDPSPGGTLVGMIATALQVPADNVRALVFGFEHPAGNKPWIWVFRAQGVPSHLAVERWLASAPGCRTGDTATTLAGLPTTIGTYSVVDQCEPEYLVELDAETVAVIVDDGGYQGNVAAATPVPYRPASEIAQLVVWLQQNLPSIPLMTGGPIPQNGP